MNHCSLSDKSVLAWSTSEPLFKTLGPAHLSHGFRWHAVFSLALPPARIFTRKEHHRNSEFGQWSKDSLGVKTAVQHKKLKVLVRPPTSSEPPCGWSLLLNLFHLLVLGNLFLYGSRTTAVGAAGTHVGIGVGVGGGGLKHGAVCDIKGIGRGSGIFGNSSKGRPAWKLLIRDGSASNRLSKLQTNSKQSKARSIVKRLSQRKFAQRYRDANFK